MRLSQSSSSIGGVDVCVGVRSLIFPRREGSTSRRSTSAEESTMPMKKDRSCTPRIVSSSLSGRQLSGEKRRSPSSCTRMQQEDQQLCERRGASEKYSSRGAESPQEERNCDTSVRLSPPLFFGRAPAGPPAAFVPRREMRAGPPPVFRTQSDNQDQASSSMRDLMIPFSHQGAQAHKDPQPKDESEGESMSMLTHVLLQNANTSNNQSLLFTGQEQPIFNATKAVAMLTDADSPTCIKRRSNLSILPRSSRSASLDQAPPRPVAPFSRAPVAFVVGTNANRSQRTRRDQGIFRSPVARTSAGAEEVTMEQALSWTEELGQHTPKAGVQCNSWTNLKVPQHKIDVRAAPLAPRPQPQFFQTPSQMQSFVPFSAWNKTAQTKQLENLSFPSLGMEDGDDDIDCEMRDCDIWCAMGSPMAGTDASAESREKNESPYSTSIWADLSLKASRSGSLLKSPTI